MKLTIDLDEILDRIYAESAWHAAYDRDIPTLTPDNARMLEMRVEDGLNELRTRLAGYLTQWNYNPHIDKQNITLTLKTKHEPTTSLVDAMHGAIVGLLSAYALMCFYGENGTYYGTAWRLHRTKIMLLLARDLLD